MSHTLLLRDGVSKVLIRPLSDVNRLLLGHTSALEVTSTDTLQKPVDYFLTEINGGVTVNASKAVLKRIFRE